MPSKDNGYRLKSSRTHSPELVSFFMHAMTCLLFAQRHASFSAILTSQIYEGSGLRALMGKCRGPRDTGGCEDYPGAQQQSQATAPPSSTLQSMRHDSSPSYDEEHTIGGSSRCR